MSSTSSSSSSARAGGASSGGPSEYFETATGNRICRKASLYGTQNIRIHGKSLVAENVTIRGDLANVKMGKHCCIRDSVVLRPSMKVVKE
ncbi:Dynactin subunit 5 [Hondaea fermentalgiana]|uniref:Dynactin subunit 5 n=1 Tax=Hondaea fermentalgiana TaxID=2315210 RepID=A0A2R5G5L0_9STRA|nr:Dynactin subunit 5 [Hondaea fermentalgiana]|eukprot:GBG26270.1 Dynactin subunit 5 [Hondaea fermentalgiana]